MGLIASKVAKVGCCFGNQVAMIVQNPIKSALVFPPCLLRYFSVNAKTISPSTFCTKNANGNMTVYQFVMNITSLNGASLPPVDVYNMTSILHFQAVLIKVISLDSSVTAALPYNTLDYTKPLQVEIINYLYYKSNELLTPSDGSTNTSDYSLANKVSLTILLVFQGFTSASEINAISSFIESPTFPQYMQFVLPVVYKASYGVQVDTTSHQTATQNVAEPIELTNAGTSISSIVGLVLSVCMMCIYLYL